MKRFTKLIDDGRYVLKEGVTSVHNSKHGFFVDGEAIDKFAALENLEKQGLLLKLPCKKGDVIYDINHGSIIQLTVIGFRYGRMSNEIDDAFQRDEWCVECKGTDGVIAASIPFSKFGEIVFTTWQQAEQALKDMEQN